jgi:hypothetical protein
MSADQPPTSFDEFVAFVEDDIGADRDQWATRWAGGDLETELADGTNVFAREREEYGGMYVLALHSTGMGGAPFKIREENAKDEVRAVFATLNEAETGGGQR